MNKLYCVHLQQSNVIRLVVFNNAAVGLSYCVPVEEIGTMNGLQRVAQELVRSEMHSRLLPELERYLAYLILERGFDRGWFFEDDEVREMMENVRVHFNLNDLRQGVWRA